MESLGENFFQNDGVRFGPAFERAWEPYAHAALEGGVWLQDGYATESLRTGDTIVSVASSASVLYYSDTVTYPDNTSEQVSITSMPYPVFDGGEKLVMQRGVGMCTTKSTPEREKACITFLKWLTSPERNVEFVTSLGYMPVTQRHLMPTFPPLWSSSATPCMSLCMRPISRCGNPTPSITRRRWRTIWIWKHGLKICPG